MAWRAVGSSPNRNRSSFGLPRKAARPADTSRTRRGPISSVWLSRVRGVAALNPSGGLLDTPGSVDRSEFLDAEAGAHAVHQFLGLIDDPHRIFVVRGAALHVGPTFGGRREIVD